MSLSAVQLIEGGLFLLEGGKTIPANALANAPAASGIHGTALDPKTGRRGSIAARILAAHTLPAGTLREGETEGENLRLHFDALTSHDITFAGVIQTAVPSGLQAFPLPYILTNCHNSLCAVGGTINEDDHVFGLSAAKKYGGVYVPPHLAVIHTYMREAWAGCGKMILGSDSHTRYGAMGTMGVGEGGGELVKQLLGQAYETAFPRIVCVYLEGAPRPGVGPQDVALALIGKTFKNGFVKNAALEFTGPGLAALSADFRAGIDVMTTETACWSSVWETDGIIRDWLILHERPGDYAELKPGPAAYYDAMIKINLDETRPMIALPFHPSNVYELEELIKNPGDVFRQVEKDAAEVFGRPVDLGLLDKIDNKGRIHADQGIIAGCAGGTFENIAAAVNILGNPAGAAASAASADGAFYGFGLSLYPGSQPIYLEIAKNGMLAALAASGVVIKTAFCGPCFGAGDVPANKGFSIRHTTRNFPNREGSQPGKGQTASVALMDARSIAATAKNGGVLTSALGMEAGPPLPYHFDAAPYRARVYNGIGKAGAGELVYGPNIAPWPEMEALGENLLVKIVSVISDPVTTTDELIPSGETSSYRSNPFALAEFTLSRKDPAYVGRAKAVKAAATALKAGDTSNFLETLPELGTVLEALAALPEAAKAGGGKGHSGLILASALFAVKPGDGSAREQAASCQRVLGGAANFVFEYATKRYRSNLINWGLIPFIVKKDEKGNIPFENGDYVFIPGARDLIAGKTASTEAALIRPGAASRVKRFVLDAPELSPEEREILLAGSLINYNRRHIGKGKS